MRLDWKELLVSTSPSTRPLNYQLVDPGRYVQESFSRFYKEPKIVIDTHADDSEKYLIPLVNLVKFKIHSIEFVRGTDKSGHEFIRGAFLMNESGFAVVHVTNALIGYGGSGPYLSRRILQMFGFSDEAFQTINEAARPTGQNYALILRIV